MELDTLFIISSCGFCHRSHLGNHLCIYQGTDAERTFASTDLYAPFQYRIHYDADGES